MAVWILKDVVLYPWLKDAFVGEGRSEADRLTGATGIVVKPLDPIGLVRLGAELWRAEASPRDTPIPPGRRVQVRAVSGLTLEVAESGSASEEPSPSERLEPDTRTSRTP